MSGKRKDKQWHFRGVERFIWATSKGRHCWSNNGFLFKGSILIFDTVVRSECSHVLCTRAPLSTSSPQSLAKTGLYLKLSHPQGYPSCLLDSISFIPSSPDRANLPFRTAVRYMLGLQDVMQASCEISPTPLSANRNRTFRVPVSRPVLQFKVTKETEHENIHLPSSQHILVKFPAPFSSLL